MNLNPIGAFFEAALSAAAGVLKAVYAVIPKAVAVLLACLFAAWLFLALGKAAGLRHATEKAQAEARDNRAAALSWQAATRAWQRAHKAQTAARDRDNATARVSASGEAAACWARVAEARRSSRAIDNLFTDEAPHDQAGCPVRGLVPAERVRDALQPRGPAPH